MWSALPEQPKGGKGILLVLVVTSIAIFVILAAVIAYLPLTSNPSPGPPCDGAVPGQNISSTDWAGYMVASSSTELQPLVTSVTGSWTVPTVKVSDSDTFSVVWIGIGGQYDASLIQVGTEQDSINGQLVYNAWYEMLPDNSTPIDAMTISPGDRITASVVLLNESTDLWSVEIRDDSNGQWFQHTFVYSSSLQTAEWIVERPTINNDLGPLADFGTGYFFDCLSAVNSTNGTIIAFTHSPISMYDSATPTPLVYVTPLNPQGDAFNATFQG